ncbi:MAG: aspartate/glutamate racemase family protein [Acidimicrobiia bacterium]|nr:aspartate/glutamate racemase family protein [Acidimicrobiia bacterium]
MKRIGLLGGMSWESSIEYERLINEAVRRRLGGTASADLIVRSYNFADIEAIQERDDWDGASRLLAHDAASLQQAGAELILLCTNTMHRVAEDIEAAITVPFLHIGDVTADAVRRSGVSDVALLGTRYTMEGDFYRSRLEGAGITVRIPDEPDRSMIHDVIYDELVQGRIEPSSRDRYLVAIDRMIAQGAQGVIGGCTEIELLVSEQDLRVPFYPTTSLHATAAVDAALS